MARRGLGQPCRHGSGHPRRATGTPRELGRETRDALARLAAAASSAGVGDERFGALLRAALEVPDAASRRAGLLALGIAVGHERLARYAGLERDAPEVAAAAALRAGTTLRGREDWARHYCLSAALAAVQSPFWSDVAGSLKEEVDALAPGTGFSFADLAADRAGVRLAEKVTGSATAAGQVGTLLEPKVMVADFFPDVSDLGEGLTPEQVRRDTAASAADATARSSARSSDGSTAVRRSPAERRSSPANRRQPAAQ